MVTVKQLAEISGVSVRTLHFYDEVGLLKPAYVGENGYRHYGEKEMLLLQQILFFRELRFELKEIQKMLGQANWEALLKSHRRALAQEVVRIRRLIKTIDTTIEHVKGQKQMKDKELFHGFTSLIKRAKESDSYYDAETVVGTHTKKNHMEPQEILEVSHDLFRKLVKCIEKGLKPNSEEVQKLVAKHYSFTEKFHTHLEKVYPALAQLYKEHPEFRKQMEPFHPRLPDFLSEAMTYYTK